MQRSLAYRPNNAAAAAIALAAGAASAQTPTITNIGVLPTGASSFAFGVSRDGKVAVGQCLTQPAGMRAVRWSGGVLTNLGVLPGGSTSFAWAASGNGRVVVGQSDTATSGFAFRWNSPGPLMSLGSLSGISLGRGVSGDGSVVVGETGSPGGTRAFRWTSAGGMVSLGLLPGGTLESRAFGVSGNGLVVVGVSSTSSTSVNAHAFRWSNGTMEDLGVLPGAVYSSAYGTSSDGSVVVGYSDPGGVFHAFRWAALGGMQNLGILPTATSSVANAVSGDGATVVGGSGPFGTQSHAFLWTQSLGMVDLNTYLPSRGLNLDGWVLQGANGINGDGTVIVGTGTFNGFTRGWIVNLDPDTDGDGLRDSWEIDGIPYTDSAGIIHRFMLPDADPMRKDLYVEVDAMDGFSLTGEAVGYLENAFENAPLTNPGSADGIAIHILRDELDLPHVPVWETDGCWPLDFDDVRAAYYGTAMERADPDAEALLGAKAKAYRYCVVADRSGPASIGGCGNHPGDNFVMYLGGATYEPIDQAAVFMHELGHNLGLGHGGGDDINGKPNYPSVMNYTLSYKFHWNGRFWRLDYTRAGPPELTNLNELSLNERTGIGISSGFYHDFWMPFGVNSHQGGRSIRFVHLNGSQTDFGDRTGTGFQDGFFDLSVVQDLNYIIASSILPTAPSPGQMLNAYNDWASVSLPLAATLGPDAPASTFPSDELTVEGRAWIEQNFPDPPSDCYANCDGSTTPPILNVNDFICFQQRYAAGDSYANCDGSTSPPILNVNDFICFQTQFAAGCP
jgi:probable HAF family extracellular repeat protein